jgi:hypothetical protein
LIIARCRRESLLTRALTPALRLCIARHADQSQRLFSARPRHEVKKKRMTANEETPAPINEATPEEEELLERSSAPTVRDLRAAAKDLLTIIEAEPDSTPPNDGPQQEEV